MKIAVLGAGNVGAGLGEGWRKAAHEVQYGLRDPSKRDGAVSFDAAVAEADVVVVALPFMAVDAVLGGLSLQHAVVVDATNPLRWEGGPVHNPPPAGSAAEHIAALTGATVVKAFNTFGAEHLGGQAVGGHPIDVLLASDDRDAASVVEGLATDLGLRPIYAGPLRQARATEQMAVLWIHLAMVGGHGRNIAFSLLSE